MESPRMLIIAGTGRESGKTTLACRIIQNFCSSRTIVAVKISPHLHRMEAGGRIVFRNNVLYIAEETDAATGKDSSRMLAAGAQRSFFVVCEEEKLTESIRRIGAICGEDSYLICESGGLRRWIEPGLFLIVSSGVQKNSKPIAREMLEFEHLPISFDGVNFSFDLNRITIRDNRWITE
jgi:hypothetical protein